MRVERACVAGERGEVREADRTQPSTKIACDFGRTSDREAIASPSRERCSWFAASYRRWRAFLPEACFASRGYQAKRGSRESQNEPADGGRVRAPGVLSSARAGTNQTKARLKAEPLPHPQQKSVAPPGVTAGRRRRPIARPKITRLSSKIA